jgi:hypothetical protein
MSAIASATFAWTLPVFRHSIEDDATIVTTNTKHFEARGARRAFVRWL